jgi:hypothetical protein
VPALPAPAPRLPAYPPQTGTYQVTPNYETLFCAGHTWASDGNLIAAGGDMGEPPGARGGRPLATAAGGPSR